LLLRAKVLGYPVLVNVDQDMRDAEDVRERLVQDAARVGGAQPRPDDHDATQGQHPEGAVSPRSGTVAFTEPVVQQLMLGRPAVLDDRRQDTRARGLAPRTRASPVAVCE